MTLSPDQVPAAEGDSKMQLSLPYRVGLWIKTNIPFRGGNEFTRQCLTLGIELHKRGLVDGTDVNVKAVVDAVEAAGHKPPAAPPAPAQEPKKKGGKRG